MAYLLLLLSHMSLIHGNLTGHGANIDRIDSRDLGEDATGGHHRSRSFATLLTEIARAAPQPAPSGDPSRAESGPAPVRRSYEQTLPCSWVRV